jgi:hypothetical protein
MIDFFKKYIKIQFELHREQLHLYYKDKRLTLIR